MSACLLGKACRYDGRDSTDPELAGILEARGEEAVPFCPEEHGGLGTPRPAAWIESDGAEAVLDGTARVVNEHGTDVTRGFAQGAQGALELCRQEGLERAYLKERSPSCGVAETHVGGKRCSGPGVTAANLQRAGIECHGVEGERKA